MANENATEVETDDAGAAGGEDAPAPSPAKPAPSVDVRERGDGKVEILSPGAYKRIKDEARARGQKEAAQSLAQELGYTDVATMKAALAQRNAAPAKPAERDVDTDAAGDRVEPGSKRWEKEREKFSARIREATSKASSWERKYRSERQAREAREAEMAVREIAAETGIRDLDYAYRLFTRNMEGKAPAEIEKIKDDDIRGFFSGLNEKHPYLWGQVLRPVTTGTGSSPGTPAAPKPVQAAGSQNGTKPDVMKMSAQEYQEYKRKLNLNMASVDGKVVR
jgi:hypothetical protein